MTSVLLRSTIHCRRCSNSLFNNRDRGLFAVFQSFNKSSKKEELGQTLILLEDGTNIRELPIIVRKVSNNSVIFCENKTLDGDKSVQTGLNIDPVVKDNGKIASNTNSNKNSIDDFESKEIIDYFNKCYTARGIFAILETIPASEVTSHVALHALKKIVTLENNKFIRNTSTGEVYQLFENINDASDSLHENETFTRTAVLAQLVDKILSSHDADVLLSGFLIVNRDIIGKYIDQDSKDRFVNEILCRVTDGKFTISQTCHAIKLFRDITPNLNESVDKLWVGITEKHNDIDSNNVMDVVRCIPYLSKSRKVIVSVVEKKLIDFWYFIQGHDIAEILVILKQIQCYSPRILSILSQWVNKNIHTASEDDLIEIINGFCSLAYNNLSIEKALERYMKVKGVSIKNPSLVASIMDYCSKFRIRSPILLQGSAEYIIAHGNTLSPVILQRLFLPLGKLNYKPTNGLNFWKVLESVLEEKFVQFRPEEAIDMLLNCVYLQKYPLNFVKKVFNAYFLDRLHSYKNKEIVVLSRLKLQELDIAMTLESPLYQGPVLPKPINSPPIWQDGRVKRMINNIRSVLEDIAGGANRVAYNLIPAKLPSTDIYVIDALVLNKSFAPKMWPINLDRDYSLHTAVLISSPEHYCSKGHHLLGRQELRKRHFRHIGLKIVNLNLNELSKLKMHPVALKHYIEEQFSRAEAPFPKAKA